MTLLEKYINEIDNLVDNFKDARREIGKFRELIGQLGQALEQAGQESNNEERWTTTWVRDTLRHRADLVAKAKEISPW